MFVGATEDVVSWINNMPGREFSGAEQGRFYSPDPAGTGWNQYAYPTNPNSQSDPSGLNWFIYPNQGDMPGAGMDEDFGVEGLGNAGESAWAVPPVYGSVGADSDITAGMPMSPGAAVDQQALADSFNVMGEMPPASMQPYLVSTNLAVGAAGGTLFFGGVTIGAELVDIFGSAGTSGIIDATEVSTISPDVAGLDSGISRITVNVVEYTQKAYQAAEAAAEDLGSGIDFMNGIGTLGFLKPKPFPFHYVTPEEWRLEREDELNRNSTGLQYLMTDFAPAAAVNQPNPYFFDESWVNPTPSFFWGTGCTSVPVLPAWGKP